jgi:hypothetical protein
MYVCTASADSTIRRWAKTNTIHTYKGHTGVVRDLVCLCVDMPCLLIHPSEVLTCGVMQAIISDTVFVSASNDTCAALIGRTTSFSHRIMYLCISLETTVRCVCGRWPEHVCMCCRATPPSSTGAPAYLILIGWFRSLI